MPTENKSTIRYYVERLKELYDDAKRQAGASLSIYGDVSDVLDALDAGEDDAVDRADNLCGTLRLRYHARTRDEYRLDPDHRHDFTDGPCACGARGRLVLGGAPGRSTVAARRVQRERREDFAVSVEALSEEGHE